jgi:uncharacterized coiled-coil DUF342 family protein
MAQDIEGYLAEKGSYSSWSNQAHALLHREVKSRRNQADYLDAEVSNLVQRADELRAQAARLRADAQQMADALETLGLPSQS